MTWAPPPAARNLELLLLELEVVRTMTTGSPSLRPFVIWTWVDVTNPT
jgi:hypothetical protein